MDSIDSQDKIQKIIKYGKYVVLVAFLISIFLIVKSCSRTYEDIEDEMINSAMNYIAENNISVSNELYVEITKLDEIEGTELCSLASGVIVTNNSGALKYQAYLQCPDYKSTINDNSDKYITLNGGDVFILKNGEVYDEPNYTINSAILDGDIVITGTVNKNPGIYTLRYDVYVDYTLKDTLYRKVIVTENDQDRSISGLTDSDNPIITLLGDRNITLALNTKYKEPGYRAVDYTDGKITRKVQYNEDAVDSTKVGIYTITYNVTNSKGNSAIAVRTVKVVRQKADFGIEITSSSTDFAKQVYINYKITGDGYSYIINPSGEKSNFVVGKYLATKNQIYTFKIYDKYGNEYIKEYEVTNIDDIIPTGSCKAVTTTSKTTVEVMADDNKGISGYSYIIDGKASDYQTNKFYETTSKSTSVNVNVKDLAGNVANLSCNIEEGNEEYINEKGYNCIQPFTCFKQGDYTSEQYQYCSTDTCGPINKRGCSITSVTTIVSGFGIKSPTGELYTPYTMLTDVYKKLCSSYCSGSTAAERVFKSLGLTVQGEGTKNYYYMTKANAEILKEHLRQGGAALLRVGKGWYTNGGHLMAILGINDAGNVYLYDPALKKGTSNGSHAVNTFVSTDDIIAGGGESCWFQLVSK